MNIVTYLFLAVLFVYSCSSLPLDLQEENASLPDYELLQEEFLQTMEAAVNHVVQSRDMHKAFKRAKRQLNNFGAGGLGGFGQGSLAGLGQASNGLGSFGSGFGALNGLNGLNGAGGLGSGALTQGAGSLFDGLENFASLASLEALGSGAASNAGPLAPVLQGIGSANNVVKTMVGLDRMRCMPRLACEYMANRGLFNRTGAVISPAVLSALPNNTHAALNISNPSTFRTVLGLLQLVRFQEFGAYPYLEAGLWGAAHRDNTRCRNQFTKCPSTSEAFISELNTTPGGLQGMFTNAIQSLRNSLPGIASGGGGSSTQPTRITSGLQSASNIPNLGNFGSLSNFGQQGLTSIGSLGALGNNIGNQQLFNPSSSLLSGGSNTGFGAGALAGNLGSSFGNPSLSSSAFLNGLGTGSLGTLSTGTNLNQLNFGNLGLNGANLANLGQNGLLLNSLTTAGGQNGLLSGAQLGALGTTQLGSLSNGQFANLAGSNLLGNPLSNPLSNGQFANLAGSNLGNFNSFGSQLPPSTFQTGFGGLTSGLNNLVANFRAGQNSSPKKETGKKWKWSI